MGFEFWVRRSLERELSQEVGIDRVGDMREVDAVAAGADDPQAAGPRPRHEPRHQMRIAGAPDEVGPQRDRAQPGSIGVQYRALGDGFGQRVRAGAIGREGQ